MDPSIVPHPHFDLTTLVVPLIGCLVTVLLTVMVTQLRAVAKNTAETKTQLEHHILEMAKAMSEKVGFPDCKMTRTECFGMVKEIIGKPLMEAIRESDREDEQLWMAIRGHRHTQPGDLEKDRVILPQTLNVASK